MTSIFILIFIFLFFFIVKIYKNKRSKNAVKKERVTSLKLELNEKKRIILPKEKSKEIHSKDSSFLENNQRKEDDIIAEILEETQRKANQIIAEFNNKNESSFQRNLEKTQCREDDIIAKILEETQRKADQIITELDNKNESSFQRNLLSNEDEIDLDELNILIDSLIKDNNLSKEIDSEFHTKSSNSFNNQDEEEEFNNFIELFIQNEKISEEQNQTLDELGIDYLFHMTHKDNLDNILKYGLKSHNQSRINKLIQQDIADNQVNDRRMKSEPIYNISIHDYVPLYFNPKNPMLFRRRNIQHDIVILAIDRKILYDESVVFTDGNAASSTTSFYNNPKELDSLNWDCINSEYWNDYDDGKRIKCSEVLVHSNIPISRIQKIFCKNNNNIKFIKSKVKNLQDIDVEVNPNLYF